MPDKKEGHLTFSLPVCHEILPAKWVIATGTPQKVVATREGGTFYARVPPKASRKGVVFSRPLRQLPKRFIEVISFPSTAPEFFAVTTPEEAAEDDARLSMARSADWPEHLRPLTYRMKRFKFPVLLCQPISSFEKKPKPLPRPDFYEARTKFLELRHTGKGWQDALLSYLNSWGMFDVRQHSPHLLVDEIWASQAELRDGMLMAPADWMADPRHQFSPTSISDPPYFAIKLRDTLQALRFTVTQDHSQGVLFRICKNENCGLPFRPTRTDREYHDIKCLSATRKRLKRSRSIL